MAVFADNLEDTLAAGSVANPSIAESGNFSTTINYQVGKTGSNNTTFPATVTFALSGAPAWVSLSASSKSFSAYSDVQSLTVSGTAPIGSAGSYDFDVIPSTSAANLNAAPAKVSMTVTVSAPPPPSDTTAPSISYVLNPPSPDGQDGWHTNEVTLTWTVTESESPSSLAKTGCDDQSITADQAEQTYSCSATSDGGSAGPVEVKIKRDGTPPTISGLASPAANGAGWNNTNVTVIYTCSDSTSGIASCGPNETLSGEGASQSSTGTAVDNAGNSNTAAVSGINIDKTAPSVSIAGGPADGQSYYFGFVPAAPSCSASDALSGLAGTCAISGYSSSLGTHTVTATAVDTAGNSNGASATYSVLSWTTYGFYAPVDIGDLEPVLNTIKGGQTVPLKFELFAGATELKNTAYIEFFSAKPIACDALGPVSSDSVEITSTGNTSLRFDTTGDQFIQNWQTPKSSGICYAATVGFQDGSTITAYFKTK